MHVLWVRIREAIAGTLEGMTLADLVPLNATLNATIASEPTFVPVAR